MNESIFGSLARGRERQSSKPDPIAVSPASSSPAAKRTTWQTSCDVALLAILEEPLRSDETALAGFARKEAELRHALSLLTVAESRALHMRVSNPRTGDHLATSFTRLTAERRARIINFIADARRRELLGR
jgi:hypothetical protein